MGWINRPDGVLDVLLKGPIDRFSYFLLLHGGARDAMMARLGYLSFSCWLPTPIV